jgi:hypothetical protein
MGELSFVLDCRLSARPKFVEKTSTVIPVIHLLRRQCTVKMTKLKCLALCISPRRTIRIHILMKMYLITCDGRVLHTHGSSGVVSFNVGHRHGYTGITEPAPSDAPRTHAYSTVTTFNDGHEQSPCENGAILVHEEISFSARNNLLPLTTGNPKHDLLWNLLESRAVATWGHQP